MYLLEFVNTIRTAQDAEPLEALPPDVDPGFTPLEIALGARLEPGLMRFGSLDAAAAVAVATGLPLGIDGVTVALPGALAAAVPEHAEGPVGYPVSAEPGYEHGAATG
jgi:hypothetical protein